MNGLFKLAIVTVGAITAGSAAAVFLLPASPQERALRRQAQAQRLIDQLTMEIWNYYHEQGRFPPGDGNGSGSLVKALRKPSRSGAPYVLFVQETLTEGGDLRNPIAPERAILYYRNNQECRGIGLPMHNTESFDLWCESADRLKDGVNNWE